MTNKKVLWVLAARSGSKSVPHKNIKPLAGVPLLSYRIKSALAFADKEDVIISTDSEHYAEIAESFGAKVPFIRPAELASDTAKSVDVVLHAMKWAESTGKIYDAVGLLEATSPFITSKQLMEAVNVLFGEEDAENIVAVREARPSTFFIQLYEKYLTKLAHNIASQGALRRQEEKQEVTPSGGFYISKWDIFKQKKTFYSDRTLAFLVPDINGLEIDETLDWLWAEFLIEKKIIDIDDLVRVD
jgi:CMP-N-acetylneuraminic acid synthetase